MKIMGILNVTPDSFSDGGLFNTTEKALQQLKHLFEAGADYVDVGAESTRPGSKGITADEEWSRIEPLLKVLSTEQLSRVSLDTKKDAVALKAAELGVSFFNNVNGLYQPKTLQDLSSISEVKYCAMHMHRNPETMQDDPLSEIQITQTIDEYFAQCQQTLTEAGFQKTDVFLDPGVGFGKTDKANLALIENARALSSCYNLLYGISRKSFIGRLFDIQEPAERDAISKVYELGLLRSGVKLIRTHNVKMLKEVLGNLNGGII